MYCIYDSGGFYVTKEARQYAENSPLSYYVAKKELDKEKDFYPCVYECIEIIKNHKDHPNGLVNCAIFDTDSRAFIVGFDSTNHTFSKANIYNIRLPDNEGVGLRIRFEMPRFEPINWNLGPIGEGG